MQRSRTVPAKARNSREATGRPFMPSTRCGFSQWAGKREATLREEEYLVMNNMLLSRSKGIRYRESPNMKDTCKQKLVCFGAVVTGVRHGADWLQVGEHFLPMAIDGKCVLLRQEVFDEDEKAPVGTEGWRDGHPILVDSLAHGQTLRRGRAEAQKRPGEGGGGEEGHVARSNEEADGRDADPGAADTRLVPGTGALYQVVAGQVEIREAVSSDVRPDDGPRRILYEGSVVELFDWDAARRCRRVYYQILGNSLTGWASLDGLGPLLRPVELLDRRLPMEPVFTAIYENNVAHLGRFLAEVADLNLNLKDLDGFTPLMHAARFGSLDCCVLLLQRGADSTLRCSEAPRRADGSHDIRQQRPAARATAAELGTAPVRALVAALAGEEVFSMPDFDMAAEMLRPQMREVAEGMLDRIASAKEVQRRLEEDEEEALFQKALAEADAMKRLEQEEEDEVVDVFDDDDVGGGGAAEARSEEGRGLEAAGSSEPGRRRADPAAVRQEDRFTQRDLFVDGTSRASPPSSHWREESPVPTRRQGGFSWRRTSETRQEQELPDDFGTGGRLGDVVACADCGEIVHVKDQVCPFCDTPRGQGVASQLRRHPAAAG
mmetsp:Transcript_14390/g.50537  ORF Transcript_14390/g.50537 Transcript_14390/m.50537 type:complete len:605 (+) Transcript_14390:166-1980(+)